MRQYEDRWGPFAHPLTLFSPVVDGEVLPAAPWQALAAGASAEELYVLVQTDWLFRMPTLRLAEAQAAGGGRACLYELAWQSPGNGGVMRACHGLDGPLLFGTYDAHLGPAAIGPEHTAEARELTTQIRTAWTSFATSGDPGGPPTTPGGA
ncbi:carboxylesterase family protein [Nonomuraea angiospora]|uniref:carboxylesterase family protein n=1 Tax=Nonomuraea angiospora TaxID=46172 RepID=UPI0029A55FE5|nr:carboxylesterase family protein [Nonomuraea angiospora]MDX3105328.1 carboxylesterase family protein [Nonomuraea angiospora]